MAINSKVAAAKKAVKPKSKKTWADNQNPPQSKSYKSAADALVKAKPVGWRWTELGAARLGKTLSKKPSTADIEKYKSKVFTKSGVEHRYLYSEARADKSDNSQKTKLKTGGRTKLVIPSGQNPPQSKSYKEETDKTVAAKPVGWRWTSYGAHKLGENEEVKPSADDIEKYKNKTFKLRGVSVRYLYPERRIDKSDTNRRKKFDEGGYMARGGQSAAQSPSYQEARDKRVHAKPIGYRFTDKRAARLHESPYEKPTAEQIEKYKDKGVYWENRMDKSDRNYTRKFEEGGVEDELEIESSEFHPVGLNEGEKLRVLSVDVTVHEDDHEEGEGKQVNWWALPEYKGEVLNGDGVLWFLEHQLSLSGNKEDYIVMDNTIRYDELIDADIISASESEIERWKKGELKLYNAHYCIRFDAVTERPITEEDLSAETGIGVYRVGGVTQSAAENPNYREDIDKRYEAKPVGWRFKTRFARRKGIEPYRKPTLEEIEKWKDKGIYYEIRFDKSDKNFKRKFGAGGDVSSNEKIKFYDIVNFIDDFEYDGDPTDLRLHSTDRFNWGADNKKEYEEAQEEIDDIEYKGNGWKIYATCDVSSYAYWMKQQEEQNYIQISVRFTKKEIEKSEVQKLKTALRNAISDAEDITNRHDYDPQNSSEYMARGGQSAAQSPSYQEARDKRVHAKPIGYRFTDKRAARLHESPYEKPTAEQIEKYKDNGVYWENRMDKSDRNYTRKFEEGGMEDEEYARGGSPKIANRDSRSYTENRYDFKGANLEGKTLENGDYVVLSYGYYPIWFYSNDTNKWYGNANGFSMTTKKQISQSRPTYDATILQRAELEDVMRRSSLGTLYEEEKADDNEPNV